MKNKRTAKILSLVLVLVMALSLLPVSASAESYRGGSYGTNSWSSWWNWGWWNWGWNDPEPEPEPEPEEPVVEEPTEPTEPVVEEPTEPEEPVVDEPTEPEEPVVEVTYPAVDFEPVELDGLTVSVSAPEGALPEGTEMTATKIENMDAVQAAVDALDDVDGTALVAADITFFYEGVEIQPNGDVTVTMTSEEISPLEEYIVVHLDTSAADLENGEWAEAQPLEESSVAANSVSFDADQFSVYTIVGQQQRRVAVHYGFMENDVFVPFASRGIASSSTSYPTSGLNYSNYSSSNPNAYLVYDFPGYTYKETHRDSENGTRIWPVLQMYNSYQNYSGYQVPRYTNYNYTEEYWQSFSNNANNNVYVIYEPKTVTTGASSQGGGEGDGTTPEVPDLPAGKTVEPNGDGTYDITLSVTGVQNSSEKVTKASVIVIFDISKSMGNNMDGGTAYYDRDRRLRIAKNAVESLAENLLSKVDSKGNKLVQMALISFEDSARLVCDYTSNYNSGSNSYYNKVESLAYPTESGTGRTNWESALRLANSLEVSSEAPTYVVFVSDGDPTMRDSRLNDTDQYVYQTVQGSDRYYDLDREGIFGTGAYEVGHYNAAVREGQAILAANKELYSIGLSNDATRMENFTTDAGASADHYFPATSQQQLNDAFDKIATAVSSNLGFTDVEIDDGVTELTTVETDALTGTPVNFVYRKGTNSNDPTQNTEWTGSDVPKATVTDDNHVIWDVASIGQLEAGVTYSVTFTVWPSQESYNIIADINNGIIRDEDGNIVRTATPAEAYAAQPKYIRDQIVIKDGKYTLATNTGANVSYKYNGVDGENEATVKKEGSMPLDTTYFGIHKDWQNQLPEDSRTAQVLSKKDADGKTYLIDANGDWILDGENKIEVDWSNFDSWKTKAVFYVDLIVTKGTEDYTEVRLYSKDIEGGNPAWTWNQMFIAPGVLTHGNATSGTFDLRETGDDYSVREKPSESYYWELKAETYHPMVINGTACVLQKVAEDDANVPADVKGESNANKYNGDYYNIGGTVYKKLGAASDALISAVNERRSYLNITKAVTGSDLTGYDADAYFTYTVKMENPNGKYRGSADYNPTNDDFWFSVMDANKETIKDDFIVTGATAEDGNTGYWHFANDQGGNTVTIKMKAGWNIRFINLLSGTTYEITETAMDPGYVFNKVEATAVKNGTADSTYAPTTDGTKINGSIENPNTDYTVTYTNDFLGYFYVYHSANNTVERLPMAENGVKVKDFDIAHRTIAGSLYGGYYTDYTGKSDGFDQTALTYTNGVATDEGGTAYTCDYIKTMKSAGGAWKSGDAIHENGLAMQPTANAVYFLKEVPADKYLRPYLHYSYYKDNLNIATAWLVSDTDDLNYNEAGFVILDANKKAKNVVSSLTVTTVHGGTNVKLTSKLTFGATGYLSYRTVINNGSNGQERVNLLNNGDSVLQYWVTPDGLRVTGTASRTYTGLAYKNTLDKNELAVDSTITRFTSSN